ncbi:transposase [Granulosicoccus sp.]|nr:transposase [Granulosicoccus sp.]
MSKLNALEQYLAELREHLGHVNRHQNFCDYLKGLLLVEGRKSVEPMAAALDPLNTGSEVQTLENVR